MSEDIVCDPPPNVRSVEAIRRGIALTFLITLLVSRKLWLVTRDYPLSPVWSWLPQPRYPLDQILFWIMVGSLAGIAVLPNPRAPLRMTIAIGILWALLDQSRWQPYFIHFMVILCCMLGLPFEKRDEWTKSDVDWALLPARIMLVATYLYSGLQKVNYQFATDVFPWMVTPLNRMVHLDLGRWGPRAEVIMAMCAAVTEALAGLLLLFPRTRRPAAFFLIGMHGFILLMIGPLGYKWNIVVWPWNLGMMLSLWVLFAQKDALSWRAPRLHNQNWRLQAIGRKPFVFTGVLIFCGIMPAFNYIDRWDSYPSFSLYSGSTCESDISVDPADYKRMPSSAQKAIDPDTGDLDLTSWSISELGAMPYPEHRIALNVGRFLAKRARYGPVLVRLQGRPNAWTGARRSRYFSFAPGSGRACEISEVEYNAGY